jgi:hypothetical protein
MPRWLRVVMLAVVKICLPVGIRVIACECTNYLRARTKLLTRYIQFAHNIRFFTNEPNKVDAKKITIARLTAESHTAAASLW